MKFILVMLLIGFAEGIFGQTVEVDSINFYDESIFARKIKRKSNGQIDLVEYVGAKDGLKKIEFYDSKQRIEREQIWENGLIKETEYSYLEKDMVIKRLDVLNQQELPPQINVAVNYPMMARENEVEGVVEVIWVHDENCIPIDFSIKNKLGYGIDEEVEQKMKLIIELAEKYQVPFQGCHQSAENFKINFSLR